MVRLRETGVSWREIDGELVVLDLASSKYLTTNESGTTLLKSLTADTTPDELADMLVEKFDIDPVTAERDVATFLADLHSRGLLETA